MLGDGRPESVVDVADAMPEDVAEADEHRQLDPAQHQVVGQLFEVYRAFRNLRRVHQDVAARRDGKVAFSPAVDFVQLGGVGDCKDLARLPVTLRTYCGSAHGNHDTAHFVNCVRQTEPDQLRIPNPESATPQLPKRIPIPKTPTPNVPICFTGFRTRGSWDVGTWELVSGVGELRNWELTRSTLFDRLDRPLEKLRCPRSDT